MPVELYLYFICRKDGVAITFDAREFPSDLPAARHARSVLEAHPSCERVVACCGERIVQICGRGSGFKSPGLMVEPEILRVEAAARG